MIRNLLLSILVWTLFCASSSPAQTGKPPRKSSAPSPKGRAIDPARLALINQRMKSFVDRGRASGIVTLVAHRGQVVSFSAVGNQDSEAQIPMKVDSIFQVASMTKPITATGIMILMEDGLLALTDPVQKYLPAFSKIKLMTKSEEGDLQEIRNPKRPITIRDLMTHMSGMGGGYPDLIKDLFDERDRTLAEAVDLFPQRPLEFEPGTQWGYSNMGIATLGRIIEVVSGKSYEEFLAERIFNPLEMTDSHFFLPEEKQNRVAVMYRYDGSTLARADLDLFHSGAKYPSPEAGLYSTAQDLFRFYQMMLNGGSLGGKRVLSKASVNLMTTLQTGDLKAGFSPGMGFGLGWSVVRSVDGMFRLNSIGTFGHGGLYRTYGFVDPQKELTGIILLQRISGDGDMADEISAFIAMASASVLE
jgi:CubicO group peptidase (beta-lactamase class C family)